MGESLTALYLRNPELANAIRRRQEGAQLMKMGGDSSPIRSPLQGLSRLAQALVGGYEQGQADKEIRTQGEKSGAEVGDFLKRAMGGGQPAAAPMEPPPTAPVTPVAQTPLAPPDIAPLIQAEAEKRGIPPALANALFSVESGFNPQARNPRSGAFGIGQVLASTMAQPGYGMQPTNEAELSDPRKAVPWSLDYLKARGGALGVTDWNDPQQQARALRAYGENTDEYVNKVQSRMGGALPVSAPVASPQGGAPQAAQGVDYRAMALEAATSRNPQLQAMAPILMQLAKNEDQGFILAPGAERRDRAGNVIARNTTISPTTQVNLDQRGPGAFEVERAKTLNTRLTELEDAGSKATSTLGQLRRVESFLDNFTTGAGSQTQITLGQLADRLNVPEETRKLLGVQGDKIAQGEAIRSEAARMLVGMIGSGGFPAQGFSNPDREMLERALPGLANSPGGNRIIIQAMRGAAEKQIEIARAYRSFIKERGGKPTPALLEEFNADVLPGIQERDVAIPLLQQGGWMDSTPAGQTTAPAPGGIQEGATAINRQNGQRLIFRGGKWEPAQ
jgi:hypothetical protein